MFEPSKRQEEVADSLAEDYPSVGVERFEEGSTDARMTGLDPNGNVLVTWRVNEDGGMRRVLPAPPPAPGITCERACRDPHALEG